MNYSQLSKGSGYMFVGENQLYVRYGLQKSVRYVKWVIDTCTAHNDSGHYYKTISKKLLSLKPVVRTQRSYKRAGLIKRQKSFQGLTMYGHEVLMSIQK
jgi:hypothetical protein